MGIREKLDKHRSLSISLSTVGILALLCIMFLEIRSARGRAPGVSSKAYYTTDDQLIGQAAVDALFVDDVNRVPPFDHNGKPAYLAVVYQCNGGSVKWVNMLQRYKRAIKPKVEAFVALAVARGQSLKVDTSGFDSSGLEVKSPGPGPFFDAKDPRAADALACKVPSGVAVNDLTFCVP